MYDIIGDIHGYADQLTSLLTKLDYKKVDGIYKHPHRKAIFVGDFIDRGPKIREVLDIVRPMIDSGNALAVMGNHEFYAIAYHTKHPFKEGEFLRSHNAVHNTQHEKTIAQLGTDLPKYVEWFKTLPMWLDLPELRVVHACWDQKQIDYLSGVIKYPITDEFMIKATDKANKTKEYLAVEDILKGKEVVLPNGILFTDKDGHKRKEIRIRWFEDLRGKTYFDAVIPRIQDDKSEGLKVEIPLDELESQLVYSVDDKPVFFGHYWLKEEKPELLAGNVGCLDFSVADEGMLVGYRFGDGGELGEDGFFVG